MNPIFSLQADWDAASFLPAGAMGWRLAMKERWAMSSALWPYQ